MSQSKKEIEYQAHQGSISAIISILNEQLKEDGITTRAVLENGKLQLLCEADQEESLEQSKIVAKIQTIFNQILPSNFNKVMINTRITKKQQSLWLEEIKEDRDQNLLWYQEIKIKKPNILQKFYLKYQYDQSPEVRKKEILHDLAKEKLKVTQKSTKNLPLPLILTGSLGLILIVILSWLSLKLLPNFKTSKTTENLTENQASPPPKTEVIDPFIQSVNLANSAYAEGIKANSKTQWLTIANKWQKASDLMKEVKPDHPRFQEAKTRIESYQKNAEVALYKAKISE